MRTTVTLEDDLVAEAMEVSGIEDRPTLLRRALQCLIEIEAGKRLARLGGSDPDAEAPPRRRFD